MSTSSEQVIERIKQAGLITKGLVYILIGGLTAFAAIGLGGQTSGRSEVTDFVQNQPFGLILLAVIALGLLAYSIWRLYQAYADPGESDSDDRIPTRLRYVYSALFYLVIAYSFAKPIFSSSSGGGSKKKQAIAQLLDKDWGIYVIGAVGLIVLGQAIFQFVKGVGGSFMKKLDDNPDRKEEHQWIKRIGVVGYCARALVFLVISYFLFRVILDHNANEYSGTKGVFQYLSSLNYGQVLLLITSVGLALYGLFNVMVARHANLTKVS